MIDPIARMNSRRAWFVPDLAVWGEPSLGEHEYLALEKIGGTTSVYFGSVSVGQATQEILFSQLTDHRGNSLPDTLDTPRVLVRPKSETPVFVIGQEGSDRFRIAHDPGVEGPVTVDLWIIEVGA